VDLAPASSALHGQEVNGISCVTQSQETVAEHTHTLVLIYVDGVERRIPGGVGITPPRLVEHNTGGTFYDVGLTDCLYWIHTHAADGIVHVESPRHGTYTLGDLFAIWGQPLRSDQVGPAHGVVRAFVNGRLAPGDPSRIALVNGATIQLDVGAPVVPARRVPFRVLGGCGAGTNSCATPVLPPVQGG